MKVIRCKDCVLDGRSECPLAYIENQTLCFVEHSPMFFCAKGKLNTVCSLSLDILSRKREEKQRNIEVKNFMNMTFAESGE